MLRSRRTSWRLLSRYARHLIDDWHTVELMWKRLLRWLLKIDLNRVGVS